MRHNTPFPKPGNIFLSFLENAWKEGLLDNYPDNHLIVKALENRITDLDYIHQLINHNALSYYSPITKDGKIDYKSFSDNFVINLSTKLSALNQRFTGEKFNDFIVHQLSASNKNGDFIIDSFLQALSEIEILSFIARINWDEYIYENPIGNNGANPEATFIKTVGDKKINVNIEVKTPEFIITSEKTKKILPAFLLSDQGREFYRKQCESLNIEFIQPRVTKLAQFLESATNKFNYCNETEINILYINWTYSDIEYGGFLEAWSILTNSVNGLLNHPDIATSLPFKTKITNETFKKISAIVVYTSSLDELMFTDFHHVWIKHPTIKHHFRLFIMDNNPDVISFVQKVTGMNQDIIESPLILPLEPITIENENKMKYAMLYEIMCYNIDNTIQKE